MTQSSPRGCAESRTMQAPSTVMYAWTNSPFVRSRATCPAGGFSRSTATSTSRHTTMSRMPPSTANSAAT